LPHAALLLIAMLTIAPPLTKWFFVSFAPYAPATVLSLLLGPHNWPLFFARRLPALQPGMPFGLAARAEVRGRIGNAVDGFILRELMQALHRKAAARPEFMVFPAGMVAAVYAPLGAAYCYGMLFVGAQGITPGILVRTVLPLVVVVTLMAPYFAPLSRSSLGRYLLLPGAVRRRHLPAWLALRHFSVIAAGTAIIWLPSALLAGWAGVTVDELGRFIIVMLLCLVIATVMQVFVLPSRTPAFSPVKAATIIGSAIGASVLADWVVNAVDVWHLVAAVGAAVGFTAVLYLVSLWRWRTIDLGG
jgi:hypothetical protein